MKYILNCITISFSNLDTFLNLKFNCLQIGKNYTLKTWKKIMKNQWPPC